MRYVLGIALGCATFATTAAAEPAKRESVFGTGLVTGLAQARDDTLVPLRFMGPEFGLTASYFYLDRRMVLDTRFQFAVSLLWDRYGTMALGGYPGLWAELRLRTIETGWGELRVGGGLDLHEDLFFFSEWNDDHLFWLGVMGIGPSVELSTPLPRGRSLDTTLGFPIMAFVSRSPRYRLNKADDMVNLGFWLGRIGASPELTSLHELQRVSLRTTYRSHSRRFHWDPWASIELDSFSEPERVTSLTFWIGVEARFPL